MLVRELVENESAAGGALHPTTAADLVNWVVVEKDLPKEGRRDPFVWFTKCLESLEAPLRSIF